MSNLWMNKEWVMPEALPSFSDAAEIAIDLETLTEDEMDAKVTSGYTYGSSSEALGQP